MLATNSSILTGSEDFKTAYSLIPNEDKTKIRYLRTEDNQPTNIYQISTNSGESWGSPRTAKLNKDGSIIPIDINSKHKLESAQMFYDLYTKPTYAGGNETQSWLVGNIDNCNILGDDYDVQGLIISNIYDLTPKFYISFERLVCSNQFATLGKNNASMYINNMGFFLNKENYNDENKHELERIVASEVEKRIGEANRIYDKLATTKLTDKQIETMFKRLTIDTVAKTNAERYDQEVRRFERYLSVYNKDDNQNYKNSLFGFVNACTNVNTRERKNPLDLMKPVLPANVINDPCNFEYLCRAALAQNIA